MPEVEVTTATAECDGRPRPRGWRDRLSRRWVVIVVWSSAALALNALGSLVPGIAEARLHYAQDRMPDEVMLWLFVLQALLVAPVVETGVLAVVVYLLRRMKLPGIALVLVAGALFALAHRSFAGEAWSVLPVTGLLAALYVWRTSRPFEDGFSLTTIVHTVSNLVPSIALVLTRYDGVG